ncbi:MAG: hypothetical protein COB51_03655 [Moraxellaceae bacterium]|nr:MAG: hypothetical protein COB51_03655 [Moraxellaceae bacterium]
MKLKNTAHRNLIFVLGERDWGLGYLATQLASLPEEDVVWVTTAEGLSGNQVASFQVKQLLGREYQCAVVDLYSGFNPDAIAVVAGTVVGGGILFMLAPSTDQWDRFNDPEYKKLVTHPYASEDIEGRYLRRFKELVLSDSAVKLIRQERSGGDENPGKDENIANTDVAQPLQGEGGCLSVGQEKALQAIKNLAQGSKKNALVISSDRGRGKSTVLGVAAAQLLLEKPLNIILVAPQVGSVAAVVEHCIEGLSIDELSVKSPAREILSEAAQHAPEWKNNQLNYGQGKLKYFAADEIINRKPQADLVLVDEAAALPTFILSAILALYKRVVFSTTIHGYEGNGQGFRLRFCKILDQEVPRWGAVKLDESVRWGEADPLERFIYRSLLLDAQPVNINNILQGDALAVRTELLDRDTLSADEAQLRELMGLLMTAHYRTTPGDLRGMLDCPNLRLYGVFFKNRMIAAAVIAEEGGLGEEWMDPIWLGQRRIRGHILPQSLSQQLGLREAIQLRAARVVRIAVHPDLQGQQLGSNLLATLSNDLKEQGFDYIGASFAVTAQVLRFWNNNNFATLRIGMSKEKSSGCHAGLVMRSFTAAGEDTLQLAEKRFLAQLPLAIDEYLRDISPELVLALSSGVSPNHLAPNDLGLLDDQDCLDVEAFTRGHRNYETCLLPLRKKVLLNMDRLNACSNVTVLERDLIVKKIIQKLSWQEVINSLALNGKKNAQNLLRQAVEKLGAEV